MAANTSLQDLGWRPFFDEQRASLDASLFVGRVSIAQREHYHLMTESGVVQADLSGRLRHDASSALDLPAVGDWVAATPACDGKTARVVHVLDRRTQFVRKAAGRRSEPQVVAANVDRVAVVTTPNNDFSARRLERYLAAICESGAEAVFVLNKADLCDDVEPYLAGFREADADTPVIVTHATQGDGLDAVRGLAERGDTLVLVGSSGVGKSTIVNRLLGGDVQKVGEIRESDDCGRHVTSHRELFLLEGGGLLMDTPGMRELQVWAFGDEPVAGFVDIDTVAEGCRFRDCTHHDEPGCAVRAAAESGTLSAERVAGYRKLQAEVEAQMRRQDPNTKARWRSVSRAIKKLYKER